METTAPSSTRTPASTPTREAPKLPSSWRDALAAALASENMAKLRQFLAAELRAGKTIYPRPSEYFAALNATPLEQVKVVILGQDPYHGPGQAHGLSFSVRPGIDIPPSLRNIYQELHSDLGIEPVKHGYLMAWAQRGVLLLNAVLSVEAGRPASHQGQGWELFTDEIVKVLNAVDRPLAFVLWGNYALKKGAAVDRKRHLVLEAPHPSPLSASRGFFGSRPFSQINRYLAAHGRDPIDWRLPEDPGPADA
jgi:uracil-DNA glycosylase